MCFGLCPDGKRGVEDNTVLIALTVLIILIVVRSDGKRSNSVCVCVSCIFTSRFFLPLQS